MKKYILVLLISFPLTLFSQGLNVVFHKLPFYSPQDGPYLETYLTVLGNTAQFVPVSEGKIQAAVEITMIFKQNGEVRNFKKYVLNSPMVSDTLRYLPNFIDIQRIALPNGNYNFEMSVVDKNDSTLRKFNFSDIIILNFSNADIAFSGIEMIESYSPAQTPNILSKAGFDMVPYVSSYFPVNMEKITFYTELYNTSKKLTEGEDFLISYFIEDLTTKKPIEEFGKFVKQKAAEVNPVLGELSILELSSGNYNLVVEARNRKNEVLCENRVFIQRNSYIKDFIPGSGGENNFASRLNKLDSLVDFMRCIFPISNPNERYYASRLLGESGPTPKRPDIVLLQKFFFTFWETRDKENPEGAWLNYKRQVDWVNRNYGNQLVKGYNTDRGRVYLQYGAPNAVYENSIDPCYYPYEIWHYYVLDGARNRRFLFFSKNVAATDYVMVHSNVNGENSMPDWDEMIKKNDPLIMSKNYYNNDKLRSRETDGSGNIDYCPESRFQEDLRKTR